MPSDVLSTWKAGLLAVIHTCGKGLGCAGAFVCGPAVLKEHRINHARTFIFSTALPPYFVKQIEAALELSLSMDLERQHLLKNASHFVRNLRAHGFDAACSASQIVPILLGNNEDTLDAAEHLQRDGFAVRAIRPPTVPEGTSRIRLSLTTLIDQQELDRLVSTLVAWRARQQNSLATKRA
jgi:8-amino-7-oxononanoate synthase